jgi:Tfp pilus assembly protein PilE
VRRQIVGVPAVKSETMMAAAHMAAMRMARQLAAAEMIPQQDAAERAFNKLARTYAGQMDTLKRYRSKGEQKMTVQHVTVKDGGQAVVGDVRAGGRGDGKA